MLKRNQKVIKNKGTKKLNVGKYKKRNFNN